LGRGFKLARRSEKTIATDTDIVLGDTMGELLLLLGASDMAFVGGSLVPNGGHNFIEPAAWQLPLLSGEHVFNFAEVARLLIEAGALTLVDSAESLTQQVLLLVNDEAQRKIRGGAALGVTNANRGAMAKTLKIIERYL
jgi:3-deoxy-D-manno-octulosonic-acid transferase